MFVADGGIADTIVARATAAGPGVRAIVRVSGRDAFAVTAAVFAPPPAGARPFACVAGTIAIEDVRVPAVAIAARGPRTFTGEDLVEIHTISAPPLIERLVGALSAAGARPARPGEFTRRAFLAGRLDLTAAEAVLALGEAASEAEARAALRQLRGGLRETIERLRSTLLDALAEIEAAIDFAHEDLERDLLARADFAGRLREAREAVRRLLAREAGRDPGERPPLAVLYGPPGAGKSSLLNALAGAERALVSPRPGTTRDAVSAVLRLGRETVEVVDLAGVGVEGGETSVKGPIAAAAAARAGSFLEAADLALVVLDRSAPLDAAGGEALERTRGRSRILVLQKADLPRRLDPPDGGIAVSARTGAGLGDLGRAVAGALPARPAEEGAAGPNARHRASLERAAAALETAIEAHAAGVPPDLVAIDLRAALDALGEVTGSSCAEDVLDRIFARFCIGK